jgi:hypothetical protein
VSPHAQLLWQSVTAPRAAVDLASQHHNTNQLGWLYVAICSVWSFVSDLISRAAFPSSENAVDESLAFFESPVAMGLLTALFYAGSYVFLRWFWRKWTAPEISQSALDAAIIVSFACSTVILLPQYLMLEGFENAGTTVQLLGWFAPLIFGLIVTTVAFAYACKLDFGKALALNLLSVVIVTAAFFIVMMIALMVYLLITGTSLDQVLGPEVSSQ